MKNHPRTLENRISEWWIFDLKILTAVFVWMFFICATIYTQDGLEQLLLRSVRITAWLLILLGWISIIIRTYRKLKGKRSKIEA